VKRSNEKCQKDGNKSKKNRRGNEGKKNISRKYWSVQIEECGTMIEGGIIQEGEKFEGRNVR